MACVLHCAQATGFACRIQTGSVIRTEIIEQLPHRHGRPHAIERPRFIGTKNVIQEELVTHEQVLLLGGGDEAVAGIAIERVVAVAAVGGKLRDHDVICHSLRVVLLTLFDVPLILRRGDHALHEGRQTVACFLGSCAEPRNRCRRQRIDEDLRRALGVLHAGKALLMTGDLLAQFRETRGTARNATEEALFQQSLHVLQALNVLEVTEDPQRVIDVLSDVARNCGKVQAIRTACSSNDANDVFGTQRRSAAARSGSYVDRILDLLQDTENLGERFVGIVEQSNGEAFQFRCGTCIQEWKTAGWPAACGCQEFLELGQNHLFTRFPLGRERQRARVLVECNFGSPCDIGRRAGGRDAFRVIRPLGVLGAFGHEHFDEFDEALVRIIR